MALGVLCLSLLLVVVDNTIVNVALPTLNRDLGAGTTDLQWIVDAYTLVFAALLLTMGHLGDRFGRRRALQVGLVLFALTSGLAALSTTSGQLIGARALMGIGAVDTTSPLSLHMLGMHGAAFANYAVEDCDALIAVGARFDDRVAGVPAKFARGARFIAHLDIDPSEINKVKRVGWSHVGEVAVALQMLREAGLDVAQMEAAIKARWETLQKA
jgi:hypothetical protein